MSMPPNSFDADLASILVDHERKLAARRKATSRRQRPDESDIFAATITAIRAAFRRHPAGTEPEVRVIRP